MASVTIQVLEGLERGTVFEDIPTPVTIGREDDNSIRLNDERVSRLHARIQEDGGRILLVDLDSTNGTRVNGHPVEMRVLQPGDQVSIGRCLLVYGSTDAIAARAVQLRRLPPANDVDGTVDWGSEADGEQLSNALAGPRDENERGELFPGGPPELPGDLAPLQRAQLSDILNYTHDQIRSVIEAGSEQSGETAAAVRPMQIGWASWQQLVHLEMELARYLKRVANPDA